MPENSGGYVYGTILIATLLAAESPGRETYKETAGAVVLALVVYWLAISYAEYVGHRAGAGASTGASGHFSLRGFARAARHELAVVFGALGPLVTVLLCWLCGASLHLGVTVAIWSAVGVIAATELWLGIRSHLDGVDLVVQTGFGILVGLSVIGLRVLLH